MTESTQAEIKRLSDYLAGLEKDRKPLFPEVRVYCPECDGGGAVEIPEHTLCLNCSGRGYTVSLRREDWERAVDKHTQYWSLSHAGATFLFLFPNVSIGAVAPDPFLALLRATEKLAKSIMGEKK